MARGRSRGARWLSVAERMVAAARMAVGVEGCGKFKKFPDPRNDRICGVTGCQE